MIEVNIDATSLRTSNCLLDFWRTIHKGYRPKLNGAALVYGTAVHKFIDVMFKTQNMGTARDAMRESFNIAKIDDGKRPWLSDYNHCLGTCFTYWDTYLKEDSTYDILLLPHGEPATEVTFNFQYYSDEYITVNLAGTIDKIGQFRRGCFAVGDYKTTSGYDKPSFFKQFERSIQLQFYVLALKWMAQHHPDSVLGQIGKQKVGAFIDALFIKDKSISNEYARSQVFQISDADIDILRQMLHCKIQELSFWAGRIEKGLCTEPPPQGLLHGTCEKKYGLCSFWNVCNNRHNQAVVDILLKRDFASVPYDPLKFGEVARQLGKAYENA